jgi:para-nitrobenzyl esterase
MDQIIKATSTTQGLRLTPYLDRVTLPENPFSPTAPALSADVPVLIGTTETEVTFFPNQPIDPIDAAGLTARFKAQVPKATDAQVKDLIDVYRKGRPKATEIDLALILESDVRFRTAVTQQAELKSAQKAPVSMYYITWHTPDRDGKQKSLHTLDLPFATGTVDGAQSMTGTGPERYALESKMSQAWAAFAHSGNPNHKGLPNWPKFDTKTRATMILDNECKVVNDPNGPERRALASLRKA